MVLKSPAVIMKNEPGIHHIGKENGYNDRYDIGGNKHDAAPPQYIKGHKIDQGGASAKKHIPDHIVSV